MVRGAMSTMEDKLNSAGAGYSLPSAVHTDADASEVEPEYRPFSARPLLEHELHVEEQQRQQAPAADIEIPLPSSGFGVPVLHYSDDE